MIDTYGREISYLRLSVTDRCNLRCRYCVSDGDTDAAGADRLLTEDEMITAVSAAASLGIRKLRLTGGEPLVKPNILSICRRAAAVPGIEEVCITTNGTLLPEMAGELRRSGVSRLNISLDTLQTDKYAYITRNGTLEAAMKGLEAALEAGFRQVKLNTVLIGGFNDDEIPALAELSRRYPVDVRFIELMPMTDSEVFGTQAYTAGTAVLSALPELVPEQQDNGVAQLYRLPHAQGRIGIIHAVSEHFCASCNRIRLTADGKLKPCLHSDTEYSIKGMSFEEMRAQLQRAIEAKPACHPPLSATQRSRAGRGMNRIGG